MDNESLPRYSYSKINAFKQCPYGFYMSYYKDDRGKQNAFAEFGSFMHLILEKYAKNELELDEMEDYYVENYNQSFSSSFPFPKMSKGYYNNGLLFCQEFRGFDENFEILEVEYEFEYGFETFKLNGFIDLVVRDKRTGKICIIDHKSSKDFDDPIKKKEYARQMYLYSLPVYAKYGEFPDKIIFHLFRSLDTIIIDFDKKELEEAILWATETVLEAENEISFEKTPNSDWFCKNLCGHHECEFSN